MHSKKAQDKPTWNLPRGIAKQLFMRIVPRPTGEWVARDWRGTLPLDLGECQGKPSPTPNGLYELDGHWNGAAFVVTELKALSPHSDPEAKLRELAALGGPERAALSELDARRIRLRTRLLRRSRAFLDARGFEEVEVPCLVVEPGCDPNIGLFRAAFEPLAGAGEPRIFHLQTSPELSLKRLLVAGANAIYRAGPVFRNGERSPRHEPEFLMVEWYRVGATLGDLMEEASALVQVLFEEAEHAGFSPPALRLPLPALDLPTLFEEATGVDPLHSFDGPTFASALSARGLGPFPKNCTYQEVFYQAVVESLESLFQEYGDFFVENFPAPLAILSKYCANNPRLARRVEGYLRGVEFANGFEELTDPVEQRRRFEEDLEIRAEQGLYLPPIPEHFLLSLEAGMPPAAGMAVGLDRLVQMACGAPRIQDIVSVPPPIDLTANVV